MVGGCGAGVFLVMAPGGKGARGLPEERFMMGWLVKVTRYAVLESEAGDSAAGVS